MIFFLLLNLVHSYVHFRMFFEKKNLEQTFFASSFKLIKLTKTNFTNRTFKNIIRNCNNYNFYLNTQNFT